MLLVFKLEYINYFSQGRFYDDDDEDSFDSDTNSSDEDEDTSEED